MVSNHISSVLRQALVTFSCKNERFFNNLEVLKQLLDKTVASDVNLHPQFMTEHLWLRRDKAPVTYVHIYESEDLSLGIFILKPGMRLPLHDHPQMFGLIKVIAGTIKITSFSIVPESSRNIEDQQCTSTTHVLTVEKSSEIEVGPDSESCLLEPLRGNLHEIESLGGPAAFIDILSPPYETEIPNVGPRKCTYYKITREVMPRLFIAEETDSPTWYWNDTYPYMGPRLHFDD